MHVRVTIIAMEKKLSIRHFECVFVALSTQYAMRTGIIAICGLSSFTVFFHITLQAAQFSKKKY
jgi:hypothetical protein